MGRIPDLCGDSRPVVKLTGISLGPDFAFDASGVQATLTTGLKAIRKYGVLYDIAAWVTQV
jgi:threonine dehydrogenase-like Zn-dependent dehydrogenase